MVRYKRYRRYGRRRSTNVIRMKFQSFMDISTSASSMQIISINAGGPEIMKRLAPQFGAYKYYKIGNISVKLVPASTLPVDPTGLSYEAGEPGVDPRDQLTPGMMRITNGEDILEDLTGINDDEQHAIYNNMLLDPRWFKWMLQSGVKRHATPRYWQIGQLHQDKWPGAIQNVPYWDSDNQLFKGTSTISEYDKLLNSSDAIQRALITGDSSKYGIFQTGHRGTLGWMPTDGLAHFGQSTDIPLLASPPEIEVMKIILPRAYKTVYYYRAFITETVYFKEPIVNLGITTLISSSEREFTPLDVFHRNGHPSPHMPADIVIGNEFPEDRGTGGNYGDD